MRKSELALRLSIIAGIPMLIAAIFGLSLRSSPRYTSYYINHGKIVIRPNECYSPIGGSWQICNFSKTKDLHVNVEDTK